MGCSQCLASCLRHSACIGPNLLCHPSSIIHRPSSAICHPSPVIRRPSSVIHIPSSTICHLSSIVLHPPSVIGHPSSVLCCTFFVSFHHFFRTFSLFSPIFCKIKNIFLKDQKFKNKFLLAHAIHREHSVVTMFKKRNCYR